MPSSDKDPFSNFRYGRYIEKIMPKRYTDGLIWHYTSAEGALGIISEGALRASSVSLLNDAAEIEHGISLISSEWQRNRTNQVFNSEFISNLLEFTSNRLAASEISDSYVACASTQGESHSEFLLYGSYAVGFSPITPLTKLPNTDFRSRTSENVGDFRVGWRLVIYDDDKKLKLIQKLFIVLTRLAKFCQHPQYEPDCDACIAAYECIIRCAVYMKHQSFTHEREVRLFGRARKTDARVEFRVGDFGIVPFMTIRPLENTKTFPISQINLGPGLIALSSAKVGLEVALHHFKQDHVEIRNVASSRR